MKRATYILICFIIVGSVFTTAIWLMSMEEFAKITRIEDEDESTYVINRIELVPREDITSFCVDNSNIYIYYDKTGLVNVYGTDGSFKYGIQISTMDNGRGDIMAFEGKLYIKSRLPIIFVFHDDQLIEGITFDSGFEKYISLRESFSNEKTTTDGEHNYMLSESGNDIIREDTQEIVCDLPEKSKFSDDLLKLGLLLLSFALIGDWKLFEDRSPKLIQPKND